MDLSRFSDEELQAIASGQSFDISNMSDAELEVIANYRPLTEPGQPAAVDDPMGVGASGVDMPTEYGAQQARRFMGQGLGLGWGEEIESALTGTPIEQIRAEMGQYQQERPGSAMAGELTGSIVNPLTVIAPGAAPLKTAAAGGFVYGAGKSDGDIGERIKQGAITGAVAVPFTWGLQKLFSIPSKALAVRAAMADEKLTAESLRTAAKQAYKEADLEGSMMTPQQTLDLARRGKQALFGDIDFNPNTHKIANEALTMLENRQAQEMTFQGLDDLRQRLWKVHNKAAKAGDETQADYVRKLINQVDDTFDQMPAGSTAIKNARQAWKQAQKASQLESAIEKGKLRAASTGSGGNVANVYLQAVRGMLENKNTLRYFSPAEIKVMEEFVKTGAGGRFRRSLAKLAPNGNGLMLALHAFSAAAVDPSTLAAAGVGMAAQASSERQVARRAQELMDMFGGKMPQTQGDTFRMTAPGAYSAEETKKKAR